MTAPVQAVQDAAATVRLRSWVDDPAHYGRSVRSFEPYANPAALRDDVAAALALLVERAEQTETLRQSLEQIVEAADVQRYGFHACIDIARAALAASVTATESA